VSRRPEEVKALYRGARRLGPGVYVTAAGEPLFNCAEILAEVGLPDTPENREVVASEVRRMVAGSAKVVALRPDGGN
jgi:hypothetical protein